MENKEAQDFALTGEEYDKFKDLDIKASLEKLENFDFTSDENLELDEYHEMVKLLKLSQNPTQEKQEVLQFQAAENVITRESVKFLGQEVTEKISKEKDNLKAFLRKYEVNTDLVKNMTEVEKDKVYDLAEFLFNNFQKIHNNLNFIFPLSQEEFKFIGEVIIKKLEYDRDGVFQIQELKEKYLNLYRNFIKDSPTVNDMGTVIDVNSLMILYHHLTRYTIKGAQTEAGLYLSMVKKMEERLMLYNAYKQITDHLSQEFVVWGGALTIDEIGLKVNDEEETTPDQTELKIVDEITGLEK
jgi:hypothetical protein